MLLRPAFHHRPVLYQKTRPNTCPAHERALLLTLALSCVIIAGCSRSGDLGGFVVGEVARYGGHTKTNAVVPKLQAEWTLNRDRNGFQASVTGVDFASVDALLQQAFGAPKLSSEPTATATGQPFRAWGAADIGVAIQLVGRTKGADIVCVRAMRDMKEVFREMDRPWWKF